MRTGLAWMTLALVAAGCNQERVDVSSHADENAYGRAELLAAVQAFSQGDRSPAGYRALAQKLAALQPKFNESMAAEAERSLALLALEPLEAVHDAPMDEQLRSLALTVWPTALGIEPKAGEEAEAYAERLCAEDLALTCKQVIPEYRPVILGALVWTRLKERARLAVNACETCESDPTYARMITRFEEREAEMTSRAARVAEDARPRQWPVAGPNAAPWSEMGLMVALRSDGTAVMGGEELPAGAWDKALASARASAEALERQGALGVVIAPSATVDRLRALASAAAAAGFRELALQARVAGYPYDLRAYRVAVGQRGGKRVQVRDIDSVQVLVQALEVALAAGVALPSL